MTGGGSCGNGGDRGGTCGVEEWVDDAALHPWGLAQTGGGDFGSWCNAEGICRMGIVLFLGTVVQFGIGALGLAMQRGVVQSGGGALCFGAWWLLLEGGNAPVPDA